MLMPDFMSKQYFLVISVPNSERSLKFAISTRLVSVCLVSRFLPQAHLFHSSRHVFAMISKSQLLRWGEKASLFSSS